MLLVCSTIYNETLNLFSMYYFYKWFEIKLILLYKFEIFIKNNKINS